MRALFLSLMIAVPTSLAAAPSDILARAVSDHVQPGFAALAEASHTLSDTAAATCDPEDPGLRAAFADAWDRWILVSHLRFGPTETDNRAFALGFWPDARGAIPRTLAGMIADQDPVVEDPAEYASVSIAARGFTALEFLLYDPAFGAPDEYGCALIRAVAADIAQTSDEIAADWAGPYADVFLAPGPEAPYRTETEAMTALYGSVLSGLEFTKDARLGRPMGTFERPRPTRAEARRAGRSVRHVRLSLEGTTALARLLAADAPEAVAALDAGVARAEHTIDNLQDPTLGDVADVSGRFRAETVQQRIAETADLVRQHVGGQLGLTQGFNALDGD